VTQSAILSAVVLLLGANAFFVAAEFALVKARGFRVDSLAADGSGSARLTLHMQARLEAYLAACQLGITMASLGLGWVGEPAVAAMLEPLFAILGLSDQLLHESAFLVGFIIFSSLHIVLGEQVPKTFAIRKAEPVSILVAYPLRGFYLLTYPLNWALNHAARGILSLFGVAEVSYAEVLSDDELRDLITVSQEHGELAEHKAQMLENLFAFDERLVGRVMIPRGDVVLLDLAGPPQEIMRTLGESPHSRFPVVDGDAGSPVGVVLAKEVFRSMLAGDRAPWEKLRELCRAPLIVPENLRLAILFESMRSERAHMALVVDEYGQFAGLITLEDLLEEIVGEIADETDEAGTKYPIVAVSSGWEAHGLASLGDVERATELEVADDVDANTLSGLLMQRLGRMPVVGDSIVENRFRLDVTAMKDNHVEQVRMERIDAEDPNGADTEGHAGADTGGAQRTSEGIAHHDGRA